MASKTEICNLAIRNLGTGKAIANLTTEKSAEAAACRAFYETARDATLRDFNWPFATKNAAAGLVSTVGDADHPTDEWRYSYRYPSDCINMQRIESGIRNETNAQRVPYKISRDESGRLVLTDQQLAKLQYTYRVSSEEEFTPDFVLAFSFNLAILIGPNIAGSTGGQAVERCERMYNFLMSKAQAQAANEEQPDVMPEADYIQARDS